MKRSIIAALAALIVVFALVFAVTGKASGEPGGNNGTLKIHEQGTPEGTESNDPKVCTFNVEGSGFDAGQVLSLVGEPQGGSQPVGTAFTIPDVTANAAGAFASDYVTPVDGTYKVTAYGKGTPDGPATDEKAKSKVFKVECEPVEDEPEVVTPLAVTFADECGPDNEVVNIPTVVGVTYTQTEDNGVITVTASPADDTFAFPEGTVTVWTHTINDAACPVVTPPVTPETPVVTPEVPVTTPEVPTETPTTNPETPVKPPKSTPQPPKDVQVIACVNGVWVTTVNGEVISKSGTCVEDSENTTFQTFSETGL